MTEVPLLKVRFPGRASVSGVTSTRRGGTSTGAYSSLNLGMHVGDEAGRVQENRRRLIAAAGLPAAPVWLDQHHGTHVHVVKSAISANGQPQPPRADAAVCRVQGAVIAVLTADCLPVLLASKDEPVIAVAHAGWRGLAAGIIEKTVAAMDADPSGLSAWLGPAIGPDHFEVGAEVRAAFVEGDAGAEDCFAPRMNNKWLADLPRLATRRLMQLGIQQVEASGRCTYSEADAFFSYRRDGECGRMASLLWMGDE